MCLVLCQELDLLIRLLDIADTSHGVPCNILGVTQKHSAKKKETAGREEAGRSSEEQCRAKKTERHLGWKEGKPEEGKMTTDEWAGRESMKTSLLGEMKTSERGRERDGHSMERRNCYCSGLKGRRRET